MAENNINEIVQDTLQQINKIEPHNIENLDERIYACNKILTMIRMTKVAIGSQCIGDKERRELADKEFTTSWLLRCTEHKKQREEFAKEQQREFEEKLKRI